MFCRAVQELHRHLVLVMERSDWVNMEEEIKAGVMNDPTVDASLRPPMSRRIQPQTPIAQRPMASVSPSAPKSKGMTPPQDLVLVPKRQPPPPPGFFLHIPEDLTLPSIESTYLPVASSLFDLSTLESLEMTVSDTPVMDKVHYCLEAQSQARIHCQTPLPRGT